MHTPFKWESPSRKFTNTIKLTHSNWQKQPQGTKNIVLLQSKNDTENCDQKGPV